MSIIREIKSFNSGTAFITLPKSVLDKSKLGVGDHIQVLFGKKDKIIIFIGVEDLDRTDLDI